MHWSDPLFAIGSRTLGERRLGLPTVFPSAPPDQLGLDRSKECLHSGIVIAISFTAPPLPSSGWLHPREGIPGSRVGAGSSGSEPLKGPLVRSPMPNANGIRCPVLRTNGSCSREAATVRPLPAMQGITCRATDGHIQYPHRPPLVDCFTIDCRATDAP